MYLPPSHRRACVYCPMAPFADSVFFFLWRIVGEWDEDSSGCEECPSSIQD